MLSSMSSLQLLYTVVVNAVRSCMLSMYSLLDSAILVSCSKSIRNRFARFTPNPCTIGKWNEANRKKTETGLEKWNAVARQPVMSQAKFRTAVPSLSTGGRPSGVIGNGRGETRCNATPSCMSLSVRPSLVTLHTSTTSIKYPIRTFLSPGLTAAFAKSGRERPVKETVHRNMSADNIPTQGIKCPRRHLSGMYFRQNIMSYAESGWETPGQRIFREGGSVHDVV